MGKLQRDPMQLPMLDGERPDNVKNTFSGNVVLDPPVGQALHRDSVGYAVVEFVTGEIGGKSTTKDGILSRTQRLKVVRMAHLGYEQGGELLLSQHQADREAAGIHEIPDVADDPLGDRSPAEAGAGPIDADDDWEGDPPPDPDLAAIHAADDAPDNVVEIAEGVATKPADWRDQLADANAESDES